MTNEQIILNARMNLVEAGKLSTTGRVLTFTDAATGEAISVAEPEEIHTFNGWKERGYSVKKGEHAVASFPIWKFKTKMLDTDTGSEELDKMNAAVNAQGGDKSMFMKNSFWFTASQVEPTAERETRREAKKAARMTRRAASYEAIPANRALVVF